MASRNVFGGFSFASYSPKNIPAVPMVMISPSLKESSMFFLQLKLLIYCIRFFIIRSKNHWQEHKDTNDVDVNNAPCCPAPNALRIKKSTAAAEVKVVINNLSAKEIGSLSAVAASSSLMFF